jgi:hypothetical protein
MADKRRITRVKQIALYVTHEQHAALRKLSARTRVPQSAFLREAVDDLLAKYKATDSVDALMPPVRTARRRRRPS